jgi:hypothetical protein
LQSLQVDFNLPQRFDITYVDSNSEKKRPIMIHRAVLGSLERFFGVLIEHYAGDFPLWLSPIQARVFPVTDTQVYTAFIYPLVFLNFRIYWFRFIEHFLLSMQFELPYLNFANNLMHKFLIINGGIHYHKFENGGIS